MYQYHQTKQVHPLGQILAFKDMSKLVQPAAFTKHQGESIKVKQLKTRNDLPPLYLTNQPFHNSPVFSLARGTACPADQLLLLFLLL